MVRLYERRWRIEINFDDLKTSQAAAMMRCKSPAMVRRQLVMHAIAYNIMHRLMQESAIIFDAPLDRISFKGTADTFRAWRGVLAAAGRAEAVDAFIDMLIICALDELPHRPGRHEPRPVKRRPKPYSLLTAPTSLFTVAASRRNKRPPEPKISSSPADCVRLNERQWILTPRLRQRKHGLQQPRVKRHPVSISIRLPVVLRTAPSIVVLRATAPRPMKDFVRQLIEDFHDELVARNDMLRGLRERIFARVRARFPDKQTFGSTSHEDCLFLYLLARKFRPRLVFEVGTHVGTSACFLAEALRKNGGGRVITCDRQPEDVRCYPAEYEPWIEFRHGYSTEVLERDPCRADLMFIDGGLKAADVPAIARSLAPGFVLALHDSKADQPGDKGNRNIALLKPHLAGRWLQAPASTDGAVSHRGFHVNLGTSLCLSDNAP